MPPIRTAFILEHRGAIISPYRPTRFYDTHTAMMRENPTHQHQGPTPPMHDTKRLRYLHT